MAQEKPLVHNINIDSSAVNTDLANSLFKFSIYAFIILLANGSYLGLTDLFSWLFLLEAQNCNYQYMFAFHLVLGCITSVIFVLYFLAHLKCIASQNNKNAGTKGKQLAFFLFSIIISGFLLVRGLGSVEINNELIRNSIYFIHVTFPLISLFFYRIHRKAGNKKTFSPLTLFSSVLILSLTLSFFYPFNSDQPLDRTQHFQPSLLKTNSTNWRLTDLVQDQYCENCHSTSHQRWAQSAHRFSSFNNPFYKFSINNFRKKLNLRSVDNTASRFCAGCHDPVPLLIGEFDSKEFSVEKNNSASAGITCTVCHAINSIDSVKGNADLTITKPSHYPFAKSDSSALRWFSNVLIKSNPDFHKRSFLKPLHKTSEFCGSCHKVSIPPEVNNYRWFRGQNHYDSFYQSGVSGHSVDSFYYPKLAQDNCNQCHMPLINSDEFGSHEDLATKSNKVHDHLFPAANTAIFPTVNKTMDHEKVLKKSARINIVGFRKKGDINGEFIGPLGKKNINLQAGETYLIEVVVRTNEIGHAFTQGTADSNQVWVSLDISLNGNKIATSGGIDKVTGVLSTNSHLINTYLIDINGNRIDQRNAEDIYAVLYNHQIPPGAADVIHYKFTVPKNINGKINLSARLNYRKFDSNFYKQVMSSPLIRNQLHTTIIHSDEVNISTNTALLPTETTKDWMALNDYGIGLYRKPNKSQFRQAEQIFHQVLSFGKEEGRLNLARLYYDEGRLDEAMKALNELDYTQLDNPWTAEWFRALILRDYGDLDEATTIFEKLVSTSWSEAKKRKFDFSKNIKLLNTYASVLLLKSIQKQETTNPENKLVSSVILLYEKALSLDPENEIAHFGLSKIYSLHKNNELAQHHNKLYQYFRIDNVAKDTAISLARRKDRYANFTSNPIIIYKLNSVTE